MSMPRKILVYSKQYIYRYRRNFKERGSANPGDSFADDATDFRLQRVGAVSFIDRGMSFVLGSRDRSPTNRFVLSSKEPTSERLRSLHGRVCGYPCGVLRCGVSTTTFVSLRSSSPLSRPGSPGTHFCEAAFYILAHPRNCTRGAG